MTVEPQDGKCRKSLTANEYQIINRDSDLKQTIEEARKFLEQLTGQTC